jgi:hypothetical protein
MPFEVYSLTFKKKNSADLSEKYQDGKLDGCNSTSDTTGDSPTLGRVNSPASNEYNGRV